MSTLSIPTSGIAGKPLAFSVSPLDVWSALGATSWTFGDGATANGTSVTHTYAAAGIYHVTLTSADVLGNTTSTSPTITIAPAPTAMQPPAPTKSATCVVPRLTDKKVKAAKKALQKADCKLGKLTGKKSKSAKVTKQSPKPGKVLPPGSKVNVKLD